MFVLFQNLKACEGSGFSLTNTTDNLDGTYTLDYTVCFAGFSNPNNTYGNSYGFYLNITSAVVTAITPSISSINGTNLSGVFNSNTVTYGNPSNFTTAPFHDATADGSQECYDFFVTVNGYPSFWSGGGQELNSCPDVAGGGVYSGIFPSLANCTANAGTNTSPALQQACANTPIMVTTTGTSHVEGPNPCIGWGYWVSSDPLGVYAGLAAIGTPPSGSAPTTDPNFVGFLAASDFPDAHGENALLPNENNGVTYYIAPVTLPDCNKNAVNADCFDVGNFTEVFMAPAIEYHTEIECDEEADPSVFIKVTVWGGLPSINGSTFSVMNTGGGFAATPANITNGSKFTIAGIETGEAISFSITDNMGCTLVKVINSSTEPSVFCNNCGTDAGNLSLLQFGLGATSANNCSGSSLNDCFGPFILCAGDIMSISTNLDFTLPPGGTGVTPAGIASLMYTVYTADPSTGSYLTDPAATNFISTNAVWNFTNDLSDVTFFNCSVTDPFPNNTFWYVPIAADAANYEHEDIDGDGCFDEGMPVKITMLNPIEAFSKQDCNGVQVHVKGGYPEFFGGVYQIENLGAGTLSDATVLEGGSLFINDLSPGNPWSLEVVDPNGCLKIINGVYNFTPPMPSFTNISATTICTLDAPIDLLGSPAITGTIAGESSYTVNIIADGFFDEIQWVLTDNAGGLVASSGGFVNGFPGEFFSTTTPVVSSVDGPFQFSIFDAYGDGQTGCIYPMLVDGCFEVIDNSTGQVLVGDCGNWGDLVQVSLGSPLEIMETAIFVGPGVTDNGDGTGSFNPFVAGPGTHDISYTLFYNNGECSYSSTQTVVVVPSPTIETIAPIVLCSGSLDMTAIPLIGDNLAGATINYYTSSFGLPGAPVPDPTNVSNAGNYWIEAIVGSAPNTCTALVSFAFSFGTPTASANNTGPFCAGEIIELLGNTSGSGTSISYAWSGPNSYTSNVQNPTDATQAGDYSVTVTIDGCVAEPATTTVEVNPMPDAIASNTGPFCEGEMLVLNAVTTASGTISYLWTGPSMYQSTLQNPTDATEAGEYTLVITVDGCAALPVMTTVEILPTPLAEASNDGPFCSNEAIVLNGSTPSSSTNISYNWSGPNMYSSSDQNPTNATEAGTYSLIVNVDGCESVSSTTLVELLPQPIAIASNTGSYCENAIIELLGETTTAGTATYAWSGPNGYTSDLQNPIDAIEAGDYFLTVTIDGCTSEPALTTVVFFPTPTAIASNDGPYCEGDAIQLNGAAMGGGGGSTVYTWIGPGSYTSGTPNPTNATLAGDYILTATINGCPSLPDTTTVVVHTQPDAGGVIAPITLCNNDNTAIDLNASLNGADTGGIWSETTAVPSVGGAFDPTNATFTPLDQVDGLYVFQYTLTPELPCIEVNAQLFVFVSDAPTAEVEPTTTVCNTTVGGSTVDFTSLIVNGDTGGTWEDTDGSGASGTFPNLDFDSVLPNTYTFTYTLTATEPECADAVYTTQIIVEDCDCPSVATQAPASDLCNNAGTLDLTTLAITTETGTWSITADPGGANPATLTGNIFDATGADAGDYEITFTLDNMPPAGCPSFSFQMVTIVEPLAAGIDGDLATCNNAVGEFFLESVLTDPDVGGAWSILEGVADPMAFNPVLGTFNPENHTPTTLIFGYVIDNPDPCLNDTARATITILEAPNAGMGGSMDICNDNTTNINLNTLLTGADVGGIWTIDPSSPTPNPGSVNFLTGVFSPENHIANTYIFNYAVTGNPLCAVDETTVSINIVAQTTAQLGASPTVCNTTAGGSIIDFTSLIISGNMTGTWTDLDGSGASGILPNLDFNGVVPNSYTFTYTPSATLPCIAEGIEIEVIVEDCGCPSVATQAPTNALCNEGDMLDLMTLEITTEAGTWTITNAPVGANPATISTTIFDATGADTGDYELTFTLDTPPVMGCPTFSTQMITVLAPPNAGMGSSQEFCTDQLELVFLENLLAGAATSGVWTINGLTPNTPELGAFNPTDASFNPTGHPLGTFIFDYTVSGSGICADAVSSVTVILHEAPTATVTANSNVCNTTASGSILNFDDFVTAGDMGGTWEDTDGSGAMGTFSNLDFNGVMPASYIFTYTTNSATAPCPEMTYTISVLVEDCACPSVATQPPVGDLCNDGGTLDLSSLEVTTEAGTWTITADPGGTSAIISSDVFDATSAMAGDYEVTFTLNMPQVDCPESSSQTITVNASLSAGTGSMATVCNSETTELTLSDFLENEDVGGTWSVTNGVADMGAFNAATGIFLPENHTPTSLTFTYTIDNADPCVDDTAEVLLDIIANPSAGTGSNLEVCNSQSDLIILNDLLENEDVGGTWSVADNTPDMPNLAAFDDAVGSFAPLNHAPGEYVFAYLVVGVAPCESDSTTVSIIIHEQPFATLAAAPTELCNSLAGGSTLDFSTLVVDGDMTGTWIDVEGSGAMGVLPNVDFDGVVADTYTFEYTTNSAVLPCLNETYSIDIVVNECGCPSVETQAPISDLCNDGGMLDLSSLEITTETGTWAITTDPGGTAATIVGDVFDASGANAGDYEITFTLDTAPPMTCPVSSSQVITVTQSVSAGIGGTIEVCNDQIGLVSIIGQLSGTIDDGVWTISEDSPNTPNLGTFEPFTSAFNVTGHPAGTYIFEYFVGGNGACAADSTNVTITVVEAPFAEIATNSNICNVFAQGSLLNFNDFIISGDAGGSWTDVDGSGASGTFPVLDFDGVVADVYSFEYTTNAALVPCGEVSYIIEILVEDCSCPSVATEAPDMPLCSDVGSLDLSVLEITAETGTWTISNEPVGSTATIGGTIFNANNTIAGDYEVTFTLDNPVAGCPEFSTQTITIVNPPNAGMGSTLTVCNDQTDIITLASLLTDAETGGSWMVTSGTPNAGAFNAIFGTFDPNGHTATDITFTYMVSGGGFCANAMADVTITIHALPNAGTSSDLTVCNDQMDAVILADLLTDEDGGGTWTVVSGTPGGGSFDATAGTFTPTLHPATSLTFAYTLMGDVPCGEVSSDVTIDVIATPNSGDAAPALLVCASDVNVTILNDFLDGEDIGGTWTVASGTPDVGTFNAAAGTFETTGHTDGTFIFTYTVVGDMPCGDQSSDVTIIVLATPNAGTGSTIEVCNDYTDVIILADLLTDEDAGGTWAAAIGSPNMPDMGAFDDIGGTFNVENHTAGTFIFEYETLGGGGGASCPADTETVEITVFETPFATVTTNANVCNTSADGSTLDFNTLLTGGDMGGTWAEVNSSGASGTFPNLDFDTVTPDVYTFTYMTNSAMLPCVEQMYEVNVLVEDCTCPSVATQAPSEPLCLVGGMLDLATLEITTEGGTWSITNEPAGSMATLTGSIFETDGMVAGDYEVTFSLDMPVAGCPVSSFQIITVIAPPTAGTGSDLDVCNDQVGLIMLANLLTGEDGGGTWTVSGGMPEAGSFNAVDGTFNPENHGAANLIFTYTVNGTAPCMDDAENVTINITEFPSAGMDNNTSTCNNGLIIDLEAFLIDPDMGGSWSVATGSPAPDGGAFDAGTATFNPNGHTAGTFVFVYTVTGMGECGDAVAEISVEVTAAPNAGSGMDLNVCNDQIAAINLIDVLTDEDGGGVWSVALGTPDTPDALAFNAALGTFNPNAHAAGSYLFEYTVNGTGDCVGETATATVLIIVFEMPFTELVANASVCNFNLLGSTMNFEDLFLNGDMNGSWVDTDGSGASGTFPNLDFDGVAAGFYTFTYTTTSAIAPCTNPSYTVEVEVLECTCPSVETQAPNSDICNDGSTLDLSDLQITTELGTWTITNTPTGTNPATISGSILNALDADAGNHELTFTLDIAPPPGCAAFSTQVLTVTQAPSGGIGSSFEVCNNQEGLLNLSAILSNEDTDGTWELSFLSINIPDDGAFDTAAGTFNPEGHTTGNFVFDYVVTGTGACPDGVGTITVTVINCDCNTPFPPEAIVSEIIECADIPNTTAFEAFPATNTTVNWYNAPMGGNLVGSGDSFLPTVAGVYYAEAVNIPDDGCVSERLAFTFLENSIAVTTIADTLIVVGETVTLETTVTGDSISHVTYSWTASTPPFDCTDCENPAVAPSTTTTYTVIVTDDLGCTASDAVTLTVLHSNNPQDVLIPNAFSPNDDGVNDVFRVIGQNIAAAELVIYGRWGEEVYRGDGLNEGWDGVTGFEVQQMGVYVYFVEVTFIDGERELLRGNVTLVR